MAAPLTRWQLVHSVLLSRNACGLESGPGEICPAAGRARRNATPASVNSTRHIVLKLSLYSKPMTFCIPIGFRSPSRCSSGERAG